MGPAILFSFATVSVFLFSFCWVTLANAQFPNDGQRPSTAPRYTDQRSYNDQLLQRRNEPVPGWENWNRENGERFPINPEESGRFAPNVTEGVEIDPVQARQDFQASQQFPPNEPPPKFLEESRIIARVGDHTIFAGDILPEINEIIETRLPGMPESVKATQREKLMEQLIPKAVEQKLMLADAVQNLPDPEKLPDIMDSVRDQFIETELPKLIEAYGVKTATELDAKLRTYGGSLRRRRAQWAENQFIGFMIRQQIDIDPEVTHQELLDYYREHLDEYAIPAKAKWQELMVRFDKFPTKDAAYRELAMMGDEVVFGAPFEAVAKRRSQGFTSQDGGNQEWTTMGALRAKELDRALFTLPINYLSDIIETESGVHIVRVLERQDADFVPFRDAQVEIREELKKEKQNAELEAYLGGIEDRIPVWTILAEKQDGSVAR